MADTATLQPLTSDDRTALRPERDEDILAQMRDRFRQAQESEADERRQHEDAIAFRGGMQWPDHIWRTRNSAGAERPCFVIDRISQYLNQIVNSYRRSPLGLRVRPKSGGATTQLADILEGTLRDIEQQSEAEIVYTTALDQAAGHGLGYWRLTWEYDSTHSFQKVPRLKPIYNSLSVYMDPAAVHPAALDASWAFLTERWATSRFCQTWNVRPTQVEAWCGPQDFTWHTQNEVLVCEYFYKTWRTEKLVQMPNGTVLPADGLGDLPPEWPTRTTLLPTVHWVKACGYTILERLEWLGAYIPIIRCEGQRTMRDGRAQRTGIVQAAADSQRMYNYFASAEAEAIALAPKAPYILYAEQIAGYEAEWDNANDAQQPYLRLHAHVEGSQVLPPPSRQVAEPAIQAISQARLLAAQDMQATVGQYEASVGQRSNEQSGTAINARKIEGEQTNYTYPANLAWSIRATGMQLLDLLPKLYTGPAQLRQVAQDGSVTSTPVNQPFAGPDGQREEHLLGQGAYEVTVSAGPSYETSRMQVNDHLTTMLAAVPPEVSRYFMDIWAQTLDFPGSQELAQRLKTLVPPEAIKASESGKPETKLVQAMNELQAAQQQLQQVRQQMQQMQQQTQVATQQVALLEQESARLKTQLSDKARDLAIETQKAKRDHEEAMLAQQIKLAEVQAKYGLQAAEFDHAVRQDQQAAVLSNGTPEEMQ
jgi:hypothetical protein